MAEVDLQDLIEQAEDQFGLRIFENLDRDLVERLPLSDRGRIVGTAAMERGGRAGYLLGRQILEKCRDQRC